jgi:hypothetical protein
MLNRRSAIYNYYCRSCHKMFDNGIKPVEESANGTCTFCGSTDCKLMGEKAAHFGEPHEGHDAVSSRSDKYWDNAEKDRLKRQKKAAKEENERIHFDAAHRAKLELGRQRAMQED